MRNLGEMTCRTHFYHFFPLPGNWDRVKSQFQDAPLIPSCRGHLKPQCCTTVSNQPQYISSYEDLCGPENASLRGPRFPEIPHLEAREISGTLMSDRVLRTIFEGQINT